jgi:hypothetical protein
LVGRAICLLFVAGLIGVLGVQVWGDVAVVVRAAARRDLPTSDVSQAVTYMAERDGWLEFRLSGATDRVRVRSHGIVDRAHALPGSRPFDYALEFKLLDASGEVLERRTYNYKVGLRLYREPDTGLVYTSSVPKEEPGFVTLADLTSLDLSQLPEAVVIQIRLIRSDERLREVNVRVYEPQTLPVHAVAGAWERLTAAEQERLARDNVYPAALLRNSEKMAMLEREWVPIGPAGVSGENYRDRRLFVREVPAGAPIGTRIFPAGIYVDRWHSGAVRLDGADDIVVRATTLDWSWKGADERLDPLRLTFMDRAGAKKIVNAEWTDRTIEIPLEVGAGTLLAESETASAFRVYAGLAPPRIELDRDQRQIVRLGLQAGESFEFRIIHRSSLEASFRLEIQRLMPIVAESDESAVIARVRYELVDAGGGVAESGEIFVPAGRSRFHGLLDDPSAVLSEVARRRFDLPANIERVRVRADAAVLIAAATRPQDAFAELMIAETADEERWFPVLPVGWDPLVLESRSVVVSEQFGGSAQGGLGHGQD